MSYVVVVKGNGSSFTHIFTSVSKAPSAGISHLKTCCRALITSNFDYLNYIWIFLIPTHGNFNTFSENCTLLVNTATHC